MQAAGGLFIVMLVVGLSGAKSFHLAVAHGPVVAGTGAAKTSVVSTMCSSRGCCHHGPATPVSEDAPAKDTSGDRNHRDDGDGGGCDLCTMLATLHSAACMTPQVDLDPQVLGRANPPRPATRTDRGVSRAVSRGPPSAA